MTSTPTHRTLPAPKPRDNAEALLTRAIDILSHLSRTLPPGVLDVSARQRIKALFSDAAVANDDTPTEVYGEKLFPLHLTPQHHLALETALKSERLRGTFANLHDFVLAAARGHSWAPPSPMHQVVVPKNASTTPCPFTQEELVDVRDRAAAAQVGLERFLVGCALSFLAQLQERWPDDRLLNAFVNASPIAVDVHVFPEKKR